MINHPHKFIFIHIPKCAGTSIEVMFNHTASNDHKTPYMGKMYEKSDHRTQEEMMLLPEWKDYFKFTIIRNPYDRIQSVYKYQNRMGLSHGWENRWIFETDFETFCKNLLKYGFVHEHLKPQKNWLCDPKQLNHIAKVERLNIDWIFLRNILGKLPHVELTHERKTYPDCLLTPKSCRIIEKLYKEDFKLYSKC